VTELSPSKKRSWIFRILHHSSTQSRPFRADKHDQTLRHGRSISDLALNFVHHQRKAGLKNENLSGLIRLCGKSMFYLPQEYSYGSLILPTCLRATAQYLLQNGKCSCIICNKALLTGRASSNNRHFPGFWIGAHRKCAL
jgi:hypothetical protein